MPHRFNLSRLIAVLMTNLSNRVSKKNPRALILSAVLAAVCVAQIFAAASAQDKLPAPSGGVNDFAEVVDPATKQRLDTVLQSLKTRTDVDLVIAVVKTAGPTDMYDYSLRVASEWQLGTRTSPRKTLLMVIAADTGQFFTQFSRAAQIALPDGLVGEMGRRMRPQFDARDFSGGLVTGVQAFVNGLGEQHNFTFAQLDVPADVSVAQTRPRTVATSSPADSPAPQPSESPSPEIVPSPTPTPTPTPTPATIQLLTETSDTTPNQLPVLDASLFIRDPFPVVNTLSPFFGGDLSTRVMIFASKLQLAQGDSSSSLMVNLIDSNNKTYDVPAEDVRPVPNFPFVQIIFRLPDNLPVGVCTVKLTLRGETSNLGAFRIRI